jgi:hypothetical protein
LSYQQIYIQPGPIFSLGPDTTLFWGDSLLLHSLPLQPAYLWQNGSTDSTFMVHAPGDYTVRVTGANGCITVDTIHVDFIPRCNASVQLGTDTMICNGSSIVLDAGAGFSQYAWSDGTTTQSLLASQSGSYAVVALDSNLCAGLDTIEVSMPAVLSLVDSVACAGDSMRLTAPLGYAAYGWSNGSTGDSIWASSPGAYTLTVLDSIGCYQSDSIQVALLSPPILLGPDTIKCPNEAFWVAGPIGYSTYHWTSGANTQNLQALAPGMYGLDVVDAFGCSISDQIQISNYAVFPANLGPDPTLCQGDTLILTTSISYLDYQWQDSSIQSSFLVDSSGSYWVTVLDANGCPSSDSIHVTFNPAPSIPAISPSGPVTICNGDSIILQATPNLASYLWSDGTTTSYNWIHQAGTYTVTVSNTWGCADSSSSVTVFVDFPMNPSIQQVSDTLFCIGQASAYQWFINGVAIPGAIGPYFVTSVPGNYSVQVADAMGCHATSTPVTILPTALTDLPSTSFYRIYPNPTHDKINIELQSTEPETPTFELFDMLGKPSNLTLSMEQIDRNHFRLSCPNCGTGMYILRVSGMQWAHSERIVIIR